MVHFVALLNLLGYVYHFVQNICRLLYHMRRHCFPKQQEALLQYIWRVASTAPRLLSLYGLMSVLMSSWCGYWVLLLLLAGWIEWSSSKRSLARRCVTCWWWKCWGCTFDLSCSNGFWHPFVPGELLTAHLVRSGTCWWRSNTTFGINSWNSWACK